jgi:hypothetical protein
MRRIAARSIIVSEVGVSPGVMTGHGSEKLSVVALERRCFATPSADRPNGIAHGCLRVKNSKVTGVHEAKTKKKRLTPNGKAKAPRPSH